MEECLVSTPRRLCLLFVLLATHAIGAELKPVGFFEDSVMEVDGRVGKFLSASTWLLEREIRVDNEPSSK